MQTPKGLRKREGRTPREGVAAHTDHDEGKRRRGRSLDARDPGRSVSEFGPTYHQVESRIYEGQFSRPRRAMLT